MTNLLKINLRYCFIIENKIVAVGNRQVSRQFRALVCTCTSVRVYDTLMKITEASGGLSVKRTSSLSVTK